VRATILSRISVDEERKNGTYAYMDQLCNKGGLHYMGRHSPAFDLQFFNLFLNKKVEKAEDFKKLRIRTATAARCPYGSVGAAPVNLQLTDYYTAMGVTRSTAFRLNLVQLGEFRLPGSDKIFGPAGLFAELRGDRDEPEHVEQAPPDLQKVITDDDLLGKDQRRHLGRRQSQGIQKLKDAKVEIYNLAPDTAKWLVDTAYDATWAYQMKRFPDVTPRLKTLLSGGK
jgi:hypothetical protein